MLNSPAPLCLQGLIHRVRTTQAHPLGSFAPCCCSAPPKPLSIKNSERSFHLVCQVTSLPLQTLLVLPHFRLECWILEAPPVPSVTSSPTASPVTALGTAGIWAWRPWHRPSLDFALTIPSNWSNCFSRTDANGSPQNLSLMPPLVPPLRI